MDVLWSVSIVFEGNGERRVLNGWLIPFIAWFRVFSGVCRLTHDVDLNLSNYIHSYIIGVKVVMYFKQPSTKILLNFDELTYYSLLYDQIFLVVGTYKLHTGIFSSNKRLFYPIRPSSCWQSAILWYRETLSQLWARIKDWKRLVIFSSFMICLFQSCS